MPADYLYSADIDLRARNLNQLTKQIQTSLNSVKGSIDVGVSRSTQSGINNVNKSLKTTQQNLKTVKRQSKEAADSIEAFGKASALAIRRFAAFTVVTTGFISLSRSIRQSIGDAIDFQREIIKISQVTGRTVKGLSTLNAEIVRLSTGLGVSSSELLQVSRIFSQTGLAARKVEIALQAVARSDLSPTFDNMIDTGEASIAIMQQFGITVEGLEAKLSAINSVSKKFAVESADITTAVRRTGGAFAAAGGDLEQFIALFTSVRSTTRESAESIATGFRTIFTRLQRTRTQNFLKEVGIDLRDSEGQFVGPLKAIERLSSSLQSLRSTDPRFAQIIEELGGFRQITKVIPLIKEYSKAQKALVVAQSEQTSLADDAAIAQEALAVQIAKVREEFEALIRTIADSASFKTITDVILGVTKAVISLSNALVPLLPAVTALAGAGAIRFGTKFFGGSSGFISTITNPVKKNSGGMIPGIGNTDTVPAMLTPGEFVLTKEAVKKAGKQNLVDFNNAAKFNRGGLVGGISNVSGSSNLIVGAIALQLISSFSELDGAAQTTVETLAALGIQLALMNTTIKNSASANRQAADIQRLKNRVDTGARAVVNVRGAFQSEAENFNRLRAEKRAAQISLPQNIPTKAQVQLDPALEQKRNALIKEREATLKRIDALNTREVASRNRLASINKKINLVEKSRLANSRKLAAAERAQRFSNIASNIGIGAAAIAGVAGSSLLSRGNANIAAGSQSATQSGLGGALSGAATGAALGALVGPVGAAVGGVVGGLVGLTTSLNDAANQIREVGIAKSVKEINNLFRSIESGRNTAFGRASDVTARLTNLRSQQILASGDAETAKNVQADINTVLPQVRVFLSELAKGSSTLQEFNKSGQTALKFLAEQQNIPIAELTKEIEEQIKAQNRAKTINNDVIKQQARESQRLRELASVIQSLTESAKQLAEFQSRFNLQNTFISGGTASPDFTNPLSQASDLFSISNINEFQESANNFGKLFGAAGERLAAEIIKSAEVAQTLPAILEKLKRQTDAGFSPEGEFVSNLDKELRDVPVFIRESIIAQARNIIGSEGKDATLITAVRKDSNAVAQELLSSLDKIGSVLADAGKELTSRKNVFTKGIADLQSAIDTRNRFLSNAIEIRQQRLAVAAGPDGLTQAEKNLEFQRRLNVISEGGPNTVAGIQAALSGPGGARQRLITARSNFQNLQAQGANPADVNAAADAFKNANLEVARLTNSLKFLADSTIKVKSAQDELAKIEAQNNANRNLLGTLAFGDNEQKAALAKQVSAVNQLIALQKSGNLSTVSPALLSELGKNALPFLDQFKNQEFQGINIGDLKDQVLKAAVGPEFAALLSPTDQEEDLKSQLQAALKEREDANLALADNTQTSIDNMVGELRTLFSTFISNLQQTLLQNEKASAQFAAQDAISNIQGITSQQAISGLIASRTGLSTEQQLILQQTKSDFTRLNKLDDSIKGLKNIDSITGTLESGVFKDFTTGQNRLTDFGATLELQRGINDPVKFDAARSNIAERLASQGGFTPEQVGEFNRRFTQASSRDLSSTIIGGGLKTDRATKIASDIINDIALKALEAAQKERTGLAKNIVDTSPVATSEISKFQQGLRTSGSDISRLDSDVLNNSAANLDALVKQRDEAKRRASAIDRQLKQFQQPPASQQNPIQSPSFKQQFESLDGGISKLEDAASRGAASFDTAADKFLEVAKVIPENLELGGRVEVEVLLNGGEVLASIQPALASLIETKINDSINNLRSEFKVGVTT